jgi:hypothetical protein
VNFYSVFLFLFALRPIRKFTSNLERVTSSIIVHFDPYMLDGRGLAMENQKRSEKEVNNFRERGKAKFLCIPEKFTLCLLLHDSAASSLRMLQFDSVLCISFCTRQKDNEGKEEGNYQLLISRLS